MEKKLSENSALTFIVAAIKNWFTRTAVIGFILLARMAAGQNLATNPGFETGDTTGWFPFGSPTLSVETVQVHSGAYACLVTNRTATYMGAAQSFLGSLTANTIYNVSAWVKMAGGTNQTMHLTMQKTDSSGTSYAEIAAGFVTTNTWTQLSGTYTYIPSGTVSSLNFYAEIPSSASNAYYIDDVEFTLSGTVTNALINGSSTVDWNDVHQRIDGFGASSAWNGSWTTTEADLLFSTNNNISYLGSAYNGAGLSLLRNRIANSGSTSAGAIPTTVETNIMQMAQARGARVWSTPWTPPAGFKSTNDIYDNLPITDTTDGGTYLGSGNNITNLNYASQLANYVASMKTNYGINLYAISIQNEPDASVNTYDACQWTGAQIHDFVTNLFNALSAKGLSSTKIMLPESEGWNDSHHLAAPSLNDPDVLADVGIVANHDYVANNAVGDQTTPASISTGGKAMWETEVALLSGDDSSINNGIYVAQRIYLFMTQAQANAYHYWWLVDSGNGGLLDYPNNPPPKRLFAFGQYSRFVRPNFYRINATSTQPSVLISAYKDTNSPSFAIVAVNTNATTDVNETFNLANFTAGSVTPWITSSALSLAPQTTVTVTNSSFSYVVPAMSIVTFVGQGNTTPTLAPVSDRTDNVGVTLLITNIATDSDLPAQTLTFSPANIFPANATLNPSSGIFTWRPLVSQADTTNQISVQVTDSGTPNLSATNSFQIIVNPLSQQPTFGPIKISGDQINLSINGSFGPDYTILTTTNLTGDWQVLLTTNSPTLPFTLTDTDATGSSRFYRIRIGP